MSEKYPFIKPLRFWRCNMASPILNKMVSLSVFSEYLLKSFHSFNLFQLNSYFFNYVQLKISPFLVFTLVTVLFFPAFTTLSSA